MTAAGMSPVIKAIWMKTVSCLSLNNLAFAKIGGEMISLGAVELGTQQVLPEEASYAVNVPDDKKVNRSYYSPPSATGSRYAEKPCWPMGGNFTLPAQILMLEQLPKLGSANPIFKPR